MSSRQYITLSCETRPVVFSRNSPDVMKNDLYTTVCVEMSTYSLEAVYRNHQTVFTQDRMRDTLLI